MKSPAPTAGLAGLQQRLSRQLGALGTSAPWRALQRRFDQCAPRERLLLIGAAAAVVLMLSDALWLGPALTQFRAAQHRQMEARTALSRLQTEIRTLAERDVALARQQQGELSHWRQRVRDGDSALRRHEDRLVGPDRMLDLLGQLLTRHGQVRVRAMQSLGRSDLLAAQPGGAPGQARPVAPAMPSPAPDTKPGTAAPQVADSTPGMPTLYRHGVELVLEGGFTDLLQTLKALEALPQHVLWGSVSLRVEQHPRSVLTLRVYTISRDRHWLEI